MDYEDFFLKFEELNKKYFNQYDKISTDLKLEISGFSNNSRWEIFKIYNQTIDSYHNKIEPRKLLKYSILKFLGIQSELKEVE